VGGGEGPATLTLPGAPRFTISAGVVLTDIAPLSATPISSTCSPPSVTQQGTAPANRQGTRPETTTDTPAGVGDTAAGSARPRPRVTGHGDIDRGRLPRPGNQIEGLEAVENGLEGGGLRGAAGGRRDSDFSGAHRLFFPIQDDTVSGACSTRGAFERSWVAIRCE